MAKKTLKGVVSMVSEKEFEDRETGEDILLYSFQIEGDKRYFRTGQNEPEFEEGDGVKFTFNTQGNKVDFKSIEVIDVEEAARAPKPTRTKSSAGRSTRTAGGNSREDYWANKAKREVEVIEPRITYAASAHDATAVVVAALQSDALSFGSTAKGKKLDMICDFVDLVAARFYQKRMAMDFGAPEEVNEDE